MSAAGPDPRFAQANTLFFCVGAQKSGTSWLNRYLRSHPDVHLPARELHYWAKNLRMRNAAFRRMRSKLRKTPKDQVKQRAFFERARNMLREIEPDHRSYADILFDGYEGQRAVGEITPAYAGLKRSVFEQMAALNPNTRFLFLMRDPVARLHSSVRMVLAKQKDGAEFDEKDVVAYLKDRMARNKLQGIGARSRYHRTMAELEAAVPPEKVGYFFYEDIFEGQSVDGICDFLGLKPHPANFEKKVNSGVGTGSGISPEFVSVAMELTGEVYKRAGKRFGSAVPAKWTKRVETHKASQGAVLAKVEG